MTKKIYLLIAAAFIQFFILAGIIIKYQIILATGSNFLVPTVSYDPRDLTRGDYLNLNYNISQYSGSYLSGIKPKDTVYVVPQLSGNRVIGIKSINLGIPQGEIFFEGRVPYITTNSYLKLKVNYSGADIMMDYNSYNQEFFTGDKVTVYYYEKELTGNNISSGAIISSLINNSHPSDFDYDYYSDGSYLGLSGEVVGVEKTENFSIDYGTDRFFIKEGSWSDWNDKISTGDVYGSWKVSKSGKILLEGLYISGNLIR